VTIINGTPLPIGFSKPFSSGSGLVQFRIRINNEWEELRAYGQGASSVVNGDFQLNSGESRGTIETLFLHRLNPVFNAPGKFQIRAVIDPEPHRYISDSIEVEVQACSDAKLAFLKAHYRDIHIYGGPHRFPLPLGREQLDLLPDCLLKRQLQWDAVFQRWAADGNAVQEGPEWEALRDLIPKLDEVNRDRFWFAIASEHYRKKEYVEVLKALDQMQDPTRSALFLRGQSESALAPEAPQAPP
jgi:hypothetical protein